MFVPLFLTVTAHAAVMTIVGVDVSHGEGGAAGAAGGGGADSSMTDGHDRLTTDLWFDRFCSYLLSCLTGFCYLLYVVN